MINHTVLELTFLQKKFTWNLIPGDAPPKEKTTESKPAAESPAPAKEIPKEEPSAPAFKIPTTPPPGTNTVGFLCEKWLAYNSSKL